MPPAVLNVLVVLLIQMPTGKKRSLPAQAVDLNRSGKGLK
jgi:hypothetical protein